MRLHCPVVVAGRWWHIGSAGQVRAVVIRAICSLLLLAVTATRCSAYKLDLVVQSGHSLAIDSVAFSSDGRTLATGSEDRTVKLWDASNGKELRTLFGHLGAVRSVAFSPDDRTLASLSGMKDNTIKLWNVATGEELHSFSSGTCEFASSVAFSPDGRTIASGSSDNTVKLWDVASGKELRAFSGSSGYLYEVAFSPDGRTLAGGSKDTTLWDTATGKVLRTLPGGAMGLESIAFSPDSRTLAVSMATGSSSYEIKLWDLASGKALVTIPKYASSVSFSKDGKTLAGNLTLWSVATGTQVRALCEPAGYDDPAYNVVSVAFNGSELASGSTDGTLKLWDVATGKKLWSRSGRSNWVNSVAFSPDGTMLASGREELTADNTIKVWDIASGNQPRSLCGNRIYVTSVAFSPDSKTLASGGRNGEIELWDLSGGSQPRVLSQDFQQIDSVAFSPDGKTLASGSDGGTVKVFDTVTGKQLWSQHADNNEVHSVAFSADGKTLATGYMDGTIKLWDAAAGTELLSLSGHSDRVDSVTFSPDGKTLASGSGDRNIKLWDASTGKELHTLCGHSDRVCSVAFSPDGRTLASGSDDKIIKLWDVATGKELRSLVGQSSSVTSVAFSPDGSTLATGSGDNTIRLWDLTSGQEKATLCALGKDDWAVATPDGHFDANNLEEISTVAWVLEDDPLRGLPPEIFMRQYFEPNLLARCMKGEQLPALPLISDLNRIQPQVVIASVTPHKDAGDLVDVAVSCKSVSGTQPGKGKLASGVYHVRLFRDGQLVAYLPEDESFSSATPTDLSSGSQQMTHTFTVKLPHDAAKQCTFTAYAFNVDKVKSQTATFVYEIPKPLAARKGRAYVIAFGVNEYSDTAWNLRCAADDARSYGAELIPALQARYTKAVFVPLISDVNQDSSALPATKDALHAVLDALSGRTPNDEKVANFLKDKEVEKVEPDDLVIIAFSCHGDADAETGEYYLFPHDIGSNQNKGLTAELEHFGISSSELTDWLRDVDAGDMTMVIDSCHSAAVTGQDFKPGPMDSRGLGQLAYYKRMRLLSASQANAAAKERNDLGHGLLTEALLIKGLHERLAKDTEPSDGTVTLKKLLQFAVAEVPRLDAGKDAKQPQQPKQSAPGAVSQREPIMPAGLARHRSDSVQTPSLQDFSRDGHEVLLIGR